MEKDNLIENDIKKLMLDLAAISDVCNLVITKSSDSLLSENELLSLLYIIHNIINCDNVIIEDLFDKYLKE